MVKPVIEGKVASFEVTTSATDAYNTNIQARMSRSVWVNCDSWYRVGRTGKVISLFPGKTDDFHFGTYLRKFYRVDHTILVVAATAQLESLSCHRVERVACKRRKYVGDRVDRSRCLTCKSPLLSQILQCAVDIHEYLPVLHKYLQSSISTKLFVPIKFGTFRFTGCLGWG
jgi:hypothetical protein